LLKSQLLGYYRSRVFATVQKIRSSLAEWHIGSLGSES